MNRVLSVLALTAVSLGLAGCGDQSITMKMSFSGQSLSVVATGSAEAIAKAKTEINASLASATSAGASVQTVDGDQHEGNKLCETDATKDGQKYHFVVYSNSSTFPASICDSMKGA